MSIFIKNALNCLPRDPRPQPKNDIQCLVEERCYYTVNSRDPNEEALLFLFPEKGHSVKPSSPNKKVADVLEKHKKIDQKAPEQGTLRKRSFCTIS